MMVVNLRAKSGEIRAVTITGKVLLQLSSCCKRGCCSKYFFVHDLWERGGGLNVRLYFLRARRKWHFATFV